MALRDYQTTILLSNLYEIRLKVPSGLGEALRPSITTVGSGALVTLYGAQEEPASLSEMALIKDDMGIESFNSLPNYIAIVQKSGTSTSTVVSSISLETDLGAIA